MFPHIDRIDPTALKPEPVKTGRDRKDRRGRHKGDEEPGLPVLRQNEDTEAQEPETVDGIKHVIDILI